MKITLSLVLCASPLILAKHSDLEDDARRNNRNAGRQPDPEGGYCTWNEDYSDGSNARAWMRRCGRIDEEAECGTWGVDHGYVDGECVWVPSVKGLVYDETGFPMYDENGWAVLQEYDEMCGGRNANEECYECFECSSGGGRCVPIDDCTPHCYTDDDCTREQICLDTDEGKICQLPNGPPKDNEDRGEYRKNKRKGGKGNRGDDAGPSESVFAENVSLSVFEPQEASAVDYTLAIAMLVLFVCALVVLAMRKLKSEEVKSTMGDDMEMGKAMHAVVDGQAVY